MLENVVDWKALFPQRPALYNAASLIGCTQQDLQQQAVDYIYWEGKANYIHALPALSFLWLKI